MPRPSNLAIISAFAALYLIWGSTYLGILFAIQTIPPLLMAGAGFLLARAILCTVARWRGAPHRAHHGWRPALVLGASGLVVGAARPGARRSGDVFACCLRHL